MDTLKDMQDLCRLCDENNGNKLYSIFEKTETTGIQILQLIKECGVPIVIYRSDPLSKKVCDNCLDHLNSLHSFKQVIKSTEEKHREKLLGRNSNSADNTKDVQLYLSCRADNENEDEDDQNNEDGTLKDSSTSTDDLTVLCMNCKQRILDASTVNGEIELCADLHRVLSESLNSKQTETESEKVLRLRNRRRKPQPFYHELDDSCSSLTEFTNTEESSQCFDQSDEMDSMDSDQEGGPRPRKRRKIDREHGAGEDEEEEEEEDEGEEMRRGNELMRIKKYVEKKNVQKVINAFKNEPEYRYHPLSLMQISLNLINQTHHPKYLVEHYTREKVTAMCKYCKKEFQNMKLLAVHEVEQHLDITLTEKIDNPMPWDESHEDAEVRNKWLHYFDENGYELDDIVIGTSEESLLIPVHEKDDDDEYGDDDDGEGGGSNERVVLIGAKPYVSGRPLGDFTKEQRKAFYPSIRIAGANKKYCHECRYSFKDNWAIESHYFSSACYYTCRYCGMRFNKQRHRFDEHVAQHQIKGDEISDKMYAASKLNNLMPRIIHPERVKEVVLPEEVANVPPQVSITKVTKNVGGQPSSRKVIQVLPKEEPMDYEEEEEVAQQPAVVRPASNSQVPVASQSKTGNQAYFCRKCYKVFFKLDEFNVHSKNCDYNQFPTTRYNSTSHHQQSPKPPPPQITTVPYKNMNGDSPASSSSSPAGRPMRNCVKEVGTYKDDLFIPEPAGTAVQTSFVCFICNTPFPTIYSRNSHMRIHKGETNPNPSSTHKTRQTQQYQQQQQQNYSMMQTSGDGASRIKQEPLEPMVEIHESQESCFSSIGDGAVSITPISKNPNQKPTINPNIMKLVQNNPNITMIKKSPSEKTLSSSGGGGGASGSQDGDNKSYKCSSCWEAFANKSHLYFHKKNQCEGSRFPCPFCKKRFGTEAAYSSHIFYSHPE